MAEASTVVFESAGTHRFHMSHIKGEGGERLVLKALQAAELHCPPREWRVIVQKKLHCSGDTATLRVTEWQRGQVILKIKPGNCHSCHRVALIMPSGVDAHDVYHKLRKVAPTFDHNWARTPVVREMALMGVGVGGVVEEEPICYTHEDTLEQDDMLDNGTVTESEVEDGAEAVSPADPPPDTSPQPVKGVVGDVTKVRQVLLGIYETSQQTFTGQTEFVEALGRRMNWGDVAAQLSTIAGLFASMNRRGYIESVKNGSLPAGYKLTHAGMVYIRDLLPATANIPDMRPVPKPPEAPKEVVPVAVPAPPAPKGVTITLPDMTIDPVQLLLDMGEYALRLADVAAKLKKNRDERNEYQAHIDQLDSEAAALLEPFKDKEQQLLLQMLVERGRPAQTVPETHQLNGAANHQLNGTPKQGDTKH